MQSRARPLDDTRYGDVISHTPYMTNTVLLCGDVVPHDCVRGADQRVRFYQIDVALFCPNIQPAALPTWEVTEADPVYACMS